MTDLILSKWAIKEAILAFEIGWDKLSEFEYYNKYLSKPTVPAPKTSDSGVTIGIGYDCGYNTSSQIIKDWGSILPKPQVDRLVKAAGMKKMEAFEYAKTLKDIVIPIDKALQVFYNTTIYKFAKLALSIYPNLPNINPVEQSVIVGLVFNRGASIDGDRRKEMRSLITAIKNDNDKEMGSLIRSMKRLWLDVKGLRIRRDKEAELIEKADEKIREEDKLIITV